jgi:cytochrome b subunit of formate dehydrogenase
MTLMLRINRICSWVLLFSIIIYAVSGLDILGRLFTPQLSSQIHLKYLFYIAEPAFAFHVSYAINRAFERWKLRKVIRVGLLTLFLLMNLALVAYFIFIQFFMR